MKFKGLNTKYLTDEVKDAMLELALTSAKQTALMMDLLEESENSSNMWFEKHEKLCREIDELKQKLELEKDGAENW